MSTIGSRSAAALLRTHFPVRAIVLALLALVSAPAYGQTTVDSVKVDPSTIDVSGGPQSAAVTAYLRNPAGLYFVFLSIGHPDSSASLFGFADLVAGTGTNGTWEGEVYVPESTPPGVYPFYLQILDSAFNDEIINTGMTVTITGGEADPPVLASVPVVTPSSIDVSSGPDTVNVQFDLSDNQSGVSNVSVSFVRSGSNYAGDGYPVLISGDSLYGTWQGDVTVPQSAEGVYDLRILAYDNATNNLDTTIPGVLTVTGGDTVAPWIAGTPAVDPPAVNLVGGDENVTVTLNALDTSTGVWSLYAYFLDDSGNYSNSSTGETLIGGDSLDGTWELAVSFYESMPEGVYHLWVDLTDRAGNGSQLEFPGVTVAVTRAPEADVTFRLDTRRVERLGLFDRGSMSHPFARIFGGPNGGDVPLDDGDEDSVWTGTAIVQTGQVVHYAFGMPSGAGDLLELAGETGGRTQAVDTTGILVLPVVSFDDLPPTDIDQGYAAVAAADFHAGDPSIQFFDPPGNRTYAGIDFQTLDRSARVAVRRYGHSGGGSAPSGIAVVAPGLYWGIDIAPAGGTFNATLSIGYDFFGGVSNPASLRVLRRDDAGQPWAVAPTTLNPDEGTLEVQNVTAFSEWTIGSTDLSNTLTPTAPGTVSVPVPPDSSAGVARNPLYSWAPAAGAHRYDLYVWPASDTMPPAPMKADIEATSASVAQALDFNREYRWRVVAKNVAGETPGPVWTFTTKGAPDLVVTDFQVPPGGFSGQAIDVQWTVTNAGPVGTTAQAWQDRFYLSIDSGLTVQLDAYLAESQNPAALGPGESYTNSRTLFLPGDAFGTRRLILSADHFDYQEELNDTNNLFVRDIAVTQTPPPDLRVDVVSVPASGFSGQEVPLLYTVRNHGLNATTSALWYDAVYLSTDSVFHTGTAKRLLSVSHSGILQPDSAYTASVNVRLPDTVSGVRYIIVTTDERGHVAEYGVEDNNSRHASLTIALSPPPDLVVTTVNAPASGNSGAPVTISWTVVNQGSADASGSWYDRVSIGTSPVYHPDSVTFLGSWGGIRPLPRDSSYTRETSVTLPNGVDGQIHLFVETDWKNDVFEQIFESNNVLGAAGPLDVSLSPWPDLTVTSVDAPANAVANDVVSVGWTVVNDGPAPIGAGTWTDSLYLSATGAIDSSSIVLAGVVNNRALGSAGSYQTRIDVRLPAGLAGGTYHLLVHTDRTNTVYEHTDEGNNTGSGGTIAVSAYPPVDLAVTSLSVPATGSSGMPLAIDYAVTNQGAAATIASGWTDLVWLSLDSTLEAGIDRLIARAARTLPLGGGEGYSRSISPVLPEGISGVYYVIVAADSGGTVVDVNTANNVRRSPAVAVTLTPPPDLRVVSLNAPASGDAGQPVVLTFTVENAGAALGGERRWFDGIFLSPDAAVDFTDARLAVRERGGPLGAGGAYTDTVEVMLPEYASGAYYLLAKADSREEVYEQSSESNNTAGSVFTALLAPPADLVVASIAAPANATVGEDMTVDWTIANLGTNPVDGIATDAVYCSADTTWDTGDLLLGTTTRVVALAPGASAKATLTANLASAALADSAASVVEETPGLFPGDYFVIVRTDVRNNIRETDNGNNSAPAAASTAVDVPALALGVTDTGTISSASPRRYRVDVPEGYDLRITATSSVAYPTIDLFTAFERMPTGNDYDRRNEDPTTLEREVFVPSTDSGSYYLLMRSVIAPHDVVTETYSVIAETLGFQVESISPDNGGSGGRVTATVRGAGFRPTSRVFLYAGPVEIAEAEIREFRNTMEMMVRWNLDGVPLGTYDVEVRNQDNSTSRLTGGFRVDPMRDLTVSIGKVVPRVLLVARRESYAFRFTNTSNVDIPYLFSLIAVPESTEISVESYSENLLTRSDLVPDSLVPEGGTVDDFIATPLVRYVPLIGRDLPPGETYGCRVTFRNAIYPSGSNFPMAVTARAMEREVFLEIQLAQIETYRASVLQQPAGADPEVVAMANDPVGFAQYVLGAYVSMGLVDSADVPSVGMEQVAVAATGRWAGGAAALHGGVATPKLSIPMNDLQKQCEDFFNFVACPAAIIDCFIDLPFIPPPVSIGLCAFGVATSCLGADFGPLNYIGCIGIASGITCLAKELICKNIASSFDPNDITGPDGSGDERWVARQQTLPYMIRFENDSAKAVVPARRVTVTQDLDPAADIRSVRLGSFGFRRFIFQAPENAATYTDRLDLRDSMGIFVDVTAGIDVVNRRISWTLNSVDPLTGDGPADPFAGLLPVNDSLGSGEGFVTYTVRPDPAAKTRDTIHAKATIVFDANDPIDTPPVFNLVDAAAPASSVRPLPDTIDLPTFPVTWGGADDSAGSGIRQYAIYFSRDGGPYEIWLNNTTDTLAVFSGSDSSQYAFFSVATDTAGNVEAFKSSPDAATWVTTGVEEEAESLPKSFALAQNYPNPFNPTTLVRYDVPAAAQVRLSVYNVLGQEVAELVNGFEEPGRKAVEWAGVNRHGRPLASGVYFYRLEATGVSDPSLKFLEVKKMMLLK